MSNHYTMHPFISMMDVNYHLKPKGCYIKFNRFENPNDQRTVYTIQFVPNLEDSVGSPIFTGNEQEARAFVDGMKQAIRINDMRQ